MATRYNRLGITFSIIQCYSGVEICESVNQFWIVIPNMTVEKIVESWDKWRGGELIQDAFPYLTNAQREFFISGYPEELQDEFFGKDEP